MLLSRLRPDILRDTESSSSTDTAGETVEVEQLTKVEVELTKVEGEQLTKPCNTGPAEDPGRRSYRRLLGVSLCVTNIGYILADLSCQVVARVEAWIVTHLLPQVQAGALLQLVSTTTLLDEAAMAATALETALPALASGLLYLPSVINPVIFLYAEFNICSAWRP